MVKIGRRDFLTAAGAALGGAALLPRLNPDFLYRSAFAQEGRTLRFLSAENITGNWDPTAHTTLSQKIIEGFVMGFLSRAPQRPEDPDEIVLELATRIELIDQFNLEIDVRDDIVFHDGTPFSAADVKATFEYGAAPDRPAQWYPGYNDTFSVELLDDYSLRVNTEAGGYGAHLFVFLAAYLPMMSAKDIAAGRPLVERLNGTGPFRFVEQRGNSTLLAAFDDYFLGKPQIPGIDFAFVGDGTTRVLALLSGEADIIERLEPEQVETLRGQEGISINASLSVENKYLWFRCSKPPFDNPLVRKAACHAIDRELILEVLGESGAPSANFISPIKFGYVDLPNYPAYDPAECQRLLAEAGYPGGQGLPELEYITSVGFYPKTQEYGELITAMLQAEGFPVTLSVMEVAAWNERLYDRPGGGPGHMIDCGWSTGSPEPDLVLRTHFHSGSKRITGIVDPEIDAALDRQRNAPDLATRAELLKTDLGPMLADKLPALSLFTSVMIHAYRQELEGFYLYPDGSMDAAAASLA